MVGFTNFIVILFIIIIIAIIIRVWLCLLTSSSAFLHTQSVDSPLPAF